MSESEEQQPKCCRGGFSRAWRFWKHGVPMESSEDDWEGNELTREEMIGEHGSDYDSSHSFFDWLERKPVP